MKIEKINQSCYKELADIRGWMLDTIYDACGRNIKEVFGRDIFLELKKLEKGERRAVKKTRSGN